jgi:hypothetical protein
MTETDAIEVVDPGELERGAVTGLRYGERLATIFYDESPANPREEFSQVATLVLNGGRRYKFASEVSEDLWKGARNYEELRRDLIRECDPLIICPVYAYDHSGLTLKVGRNDKNPFTVDAEWDSAQVGFAFVSKVKYAEAGGPANPSTEDLLALLDAEVDEYSHYLNGDVYGYVVTGPGDEASGCWGFYDLDEAIVAAKEDLGLDVDIVQDVSTIA